MRRSGIASFIKAASANSCSVVTLQCCNIIRNAGDCYSFQTAGIVPCNLRNSFILAGAISYCADDGGGNGRGEYYLYYCKAYRGHIPKLHFIRPFSKVLCSPGPSIISNLYCDPNQNIIHQKNHGPILCKVTNLFSRLKKYPFRPD